MIRWILTGIIAVLFCSASSAQTLTISGTLKGQPALNPLIGATVSLRSVSDSNFFQSRITDTTGAFSFGSLFRDSFVVSFSYVGYRPENTSVRLDTTDVTLDIVLSLAGSSELGTVIIRSTVSPVTQRDDTLQISASQFKVNRDASAEDLVRKVPGITVQNGQVQAQGENVQRVTIDGRELFGDDAAAALRNLPAEVIDKIQIFDRLSDQAQFTGFDDGTAAKSINIITKANMRNGQFGRVFAGYGTDERYQAGGNTTFFKDSRRISLVANFNNINQQNFSQQDLLGVSNNDNNRGNRGNRGGGGREGRDGGGGRNFQANSNFLVGQQNGINRTKALGINYSDLWGKNLTATGSYLFNRTDNTTNQLANLEYFSGKVRDISRVLDTTRSTSANTSHRFNMRIEWRIDSNDQIIFSPNASIQLNDQQSLIGSRTFFFPEGSDLIGFNRNFNNSDRQAANLNSSLLWRHSFAKRGRSLSVNLQTSLNNRDGNTFLETYVRTLDSLGQYDDDSTNRFTDQYSKTLGLETNIAYTEPIGTKGQLQLNYNPEFSRGKSDQQVFNFNKSTNTFSDFEPNLSNVFENTTTEQNVGLSYRLGDRNRQISVGANYQHTELNSRRTYPIVANVNKTFSNILPNANIRYTINPRNNFRLFYRARVNQPSVNQLQDVLDLTGAPVYSIGSPDLEQQFTHFMTARYTFTNPQKGLLIVGNVYYQTADNYIANATFNSTDTVISGEAIEGAYRLSKPVNLDGYKSFRSFLTFATPLRFIKTNLNLNGGYTVTQLPGLINGLRNESRNRTLTIGSVLASNISEYVDFTISYSANFSTVENSLNTSPSDEYFQHTAGMNLNLLSKSGWFFQNDLNNYYFSGLAQNFNQNYWLWNMGIGKKFLKDQKGEIKLSVFDLLEQNQSISRVVTESYIEDVQNEVLQRYFMLTFTYNLRNFGK